MTTRLRPYLIVAETLVAIGGLVLGTLSMFGVVGFWGLLGWFFALFEAVRVLTVRRRSANTDHSQLTKSISLSIRIVVATFAVFCLTFLVAMGAAIAANPAAFGPGARIDMCVIAVVGTLSGATAFWLAWR